MDTFGTICFDHYTEVAFVEGLFGTQTVHLGPSIYITVEGWPLRAVHWYDPLVSCYRVLLDGLSTFSINSAGLICLHRLSRLEPPRKEPLTHKLWTWLALRRKLPQPAAELFKC